MFVENFIDFRTSAEIIGCSGNRKRYVLSEDESTLRDELLTMHWLAENLRGVMNMLIFTHLL
jgi:hypothetical protein